MQTPCHSFPTERPGPSGRRGGKFCPVTVLASLLAFATLCGLHQSDVFMEPNLSFLANRAISAPATEAPATTAPAHAPAGHSDFAEVLNGQALKAQRQHLAAQDRPGQGLQVVPLGSKLNVITSDAPLPDLDSLAQFARMQGLDEGAVQALFGTPATVKIATQDLSTVLATVGADSAAGNLGAGLATPPTLEDAQAETSAQALPDPSSADALLALGNGAFIVAPPPTLAPSATAHLVVPAVLATQEISIGLGVAPRAAVAITPEPNAAPALALSTTAAQTTLMPMAVQAWIGSAPVAPLDASTPTAPLAPQDALRLTLAMPAPEITKRLAQMSGTGKETTWAALLASGPQAQDLHGPIETVTLELPTGFDPDLLARTTDANTPQPSDLATQAGAAGPLSAATASHGAAGGNSADTAQAQADQRAQQFQQLADKMGQAAAQRLMAQIERGQWKMQMRMQPATLGSINVELDMHAGRLDALFSTDNAVTRELMAQGSNKLRDTLTQAGMTVASVSVNGEQSRQSGGNSTPGKGRSLPSGGRPASSLAGAAVTAPQGVQTAADEGLNVLA